MAELIVLRRLLADETHTQAMARAVADVLAPGDVVALEGDLGAGKTTFTRSLAHALGADPALVSSPTFVIVNEYPLAAPVRGIARVVHADAYRLTSSDDLEPLGWDRFTTPQRAAARDAVLLVEWPSRIADALAADRLVIKLAPDADVGPDARRMEIHAPASWRGRPRMDLLMHQVPVKCRITGRLVHPTSPTYPFYDERAKMADLNRWFSGSYTISRPITPEDLDEA
jgi:tRNA threonylcarbamoyl adenosine modification protein YjeE